MNRMNKSNKVKWLRLGFLGAALAAVNIHAETWQVLLPSNDPELGQPTGWGVALQFDPFAPADDPNPGCYLGIINASPGEASILKLSSNKLVDPAFTQVDVQPVDSALSSVYRIVYEESTRTLYAVGSGPQNPNARKLVTVARVRAFAEGGASWVDDDLAYLTAASSRATGADAGGGYVYASGTASSSWVVRRKVATAASGSWATVYSQRAQDLNMNPKLCFYPGKAATAESPGSPPAVFTVSVFNSKWTVMRSQSQGALGTWSAVDIWPAQPKTAQATPYDVACDRSGNLYVVGCHGLNAQDPSGWVVRFSSQGGDSGTWNTVLDTAEGVGSWASRIGFDASDNIWITGVTNPSGTKPLWTVLRKRQGQSWPESAAARVRPFGDNTNSKGAGLTADDFGNVFMTGLVSNWQDADETVFAGDRAAVLRISP
jgi:hypothetical protein